MSDWRPGRGERLEDKTLSTNLRRRPWGVLLQAHLSLVLWEGLSKALGVMLPTVAEQLGTETWPVGSTIGVMQATRGFTGPMLTYLEARYQCHHIVFVSGLLAGVGVIAAAFTTSVLQLAICLVILPGFGFGIILNTALVLLGENFQQWYACANGIAYCGISIGILVYAPLAQLLMDTYGWQGALLLIGAIQLHLALMSSLLKPIPPPRGEHGAYLKIQADEGPVKDHERKICDERQRSFCGRCLKFLSGAVEAGNLELFSEFSFLTLIVCMSNLCFLSVAWIVYSVPHLMVKGLTTSEATDVVWAGAIGTIVGQVGHGLLVDFNLLRGRTVMYAANVMMGLTLLYDPMLNKTWPLVVNNFVFGTGLGIALPLTFTMLRDAVGVERMTNAVGWTEAAGGVFRILASFFTGWLYDKIGSYNLSFVVLGCAPCLVILFFIVEDVYRFVQRRRRGPSV